VTTEYNAQVWQGCMKNIWLLFMLTAARAGSSTPRRRQQEERSVVVPAGVLQGGAIPGRSSSPLQRCKWTAAILYPVWPCSLQAVSFLPFPGLVCVICELLLLEFQKGSLLCQLCGLHLFVCLCMVRNLVAAFFSLASTSWTWLLRLALLSNRFRVK
jgi:hypothetical protein